MENDADKKKKEEELKVLVEYLKRGTLLLDLNELEAFSFQINTNDEVCKELAVYINEEGVKPENYETIIRPKAVKIMEYMFDENKKNELITVLKDIEVKYGDNEELKRICLASRLFLEDKKANHKYLPIAVARLLEDIYAAFFINQASA